MRSLTKLNEAEHAMSVDNMNNGPKHGESQLSKGCSRLSRVVQVVLRELQ